MGGRGRPARGRGHTGRGLGLWADRAVYDAGEQDHSGAIPQAPHSLTSHADRIRLPRHRCPLERPRNATLARVLGRLRSLQGGKRAKRSPGHRLLLHLRAASRHAAGRLGFRAPREAFLLARRRERPRCRAPDGRRGEDLHPPPLHRGLHPHRRLRPPPAEALRRLGAEARGGGRRRPRPLGGGLEAALPERLVPLRLLLPLPPLSGPLRSHRPLELAGGIHRRRLSVSALQSWHRPLAQDRALPVPFPAW
mmetsp:Transcript_40457/g.116862  ORF Transcript_40457/g.116862 Transcript_40457/m.116862 type:complete len:251 (-) Transcript_40457:148-900(-)